MTTPYASLDVTKRELKAESTVEDAKLYDRIMQCSARVDGLFQQRRPMFAPYIESRQFLLVPEYVNSYYNIFLFNDFLLSLTSVSVNGTTLTVGTTVEAWPTLSSPIHKLRLKDASNSWYDYCSSDLSPMMITINGIWGFHRDYAYAWLHVDDLQGSLNDSATTFTVADADGADPYGRTPRFSQGNLLRVGTEYMLVASVNTTTNVITVYRGVNGSTAAAHSSGDDVEVWQVEPSVERLVSRQASFMYARRGAFESANITDFGQIQFPSDLLGEVRGIMQVFAYE